MQFGLVFPPQTELDLQAYAEDMVTAGYMDGRSAIDPLDCPPGENHAPAYRWGWQNAIRDKTHKDDGYDHLRHTYLMAIREQKSAAAKVTG